MWVGTLDQGWSNFKCWRSTSIVRQWSIDSERLDVRVMQDCRLGRVYPGIYISLPHNIHYFSQIKCMYALKCPWNCKNDDICSSVSRLRYFDSIFIKENAFLLSKTEMSQNLPSLFITFCFVYLTAKQNLWLVLYRILIL